ncbi:hypothetical protein G7Y89_g2298 [Cudoniella acicularis]|uniref:Uncharacterized protein n=1 Tax=Cudoniella acicularis TaxID=354080 RepID=A0A8H4RVD1_9HELO|nr:hypothetical protein G7Y89_g2298 [Cudoniella acicularis]
MPLMETVTIINKSGKVVSTGKHLVNIFKDAKQAYNEKKAEMKAEQQKQIEYKTAQRLIEAREETRSVASSRRSRHSRSSRHHRDRALTTRPPLTETNLTHISEGSVTSSRRSQSSQPRSRRALSPQSPPEYRRAYLEDVEVPNPGLVRRHTDLPNTTQLSRRTAPPPYSVHSGSVSNPDFHENIDMNLAYGELHHPPQPAIEQEEELQATVSKLDALLLEAHCLQHSATTIISNLQANPEAMAAVALTLAELSNILTKMSPAILAALKSSSPAIFGLLVAPEFLIAGGVALGVTVVMFGGYKIIKRIQANNEAKKEANRMEEAMVYDGLEMGSIESWRRGIADVEAQSVSTSVDGEFITPEAARQKKERIQERAKEERHRRPRADSVVSERTLRRADSESTIGERGRDPPPEVILKQDDASSHRMWQIGETEEAS